MEIEPKRDTTRELAIVTGASSGIGYHLALECAHRGFDLIVAADEPSIEDAAERFRALGGVAVPVMADLATVEGVNKLLAATNDRPINMLLANAGHGLGRAFLDQDFAQIGHVINTNITGTLYLTHVIGRQMRSRGAGKILITGSLAGLLPGPFEAVYNGTKAFLNSFTLALRSELNDSGVTVTCLEPGITDAEFFARADMLDTKLAESEKDDPSVVAKRGVQAMIDGEAVAIPGALNEFYAAVMNILPAHFLAAQHRKMTEPGTADQS